MARIYTGIEPLVGGTPLLALTRYGKAHHFTATVLAKLEYLNPAGSAKDRVGLSLILDAEERGLLKPGATIIEPTSGNTGIGLACIAAARGYKVILTMPDTMSAERRSMLAAYGAQLVLTPGAQGMQGAVGKAQELSGIGAVDDMGGSCQRAAAQRGFIHHIHGIQQAFFVPQHHFTVGH